MEIKVDIKEVKVKREKYYRTIISLSEHDNTFIKQNKLSPTKIMREAVKYLKENDTSLAEFNKRSHSLVVKGG